MKRNHRPWPIRWRQMLAHWLINRDLLSNRMGRWLQHGVAKADFRKWAKRID